MDNETLEKSQSLEEMLRQIKKIMSEEINIENKVAPQESKQEDILELSASSIIDELIGSSNSALQESPATPASGNQDVLEKIDNILDKNPSTAAPSASAQKDDILSNLVSADVKPAEEAAATEANPVELTIIEPEPTNAINVPVLEKVEEPIQEKEPTPTISEVNDLDSSAKKDQDTLLSNQTTQESVDVLKNLIKSVEKPISDGLSFRSGITMEQIVIEMIKPKLGEWLDENLPNIVRHVVEKEVKKLIPREDD